MEGLDIYLYMPLDPHADPHTSLDKRSLFVKPGPFSPIQSHREQPCTAFFTELEAQFLHKMRQPSNGRPWFQDNASVVDIIEQVLRTVLYFEISLICLLYLWDKSKHRGQTKESQYASANERVQSPRRLRSAHREDERDQSPEEVMSWVDKDV